MHTSNVPDTVPSSSCIFINLIIITILPGRYNIVPILQMRASSTPKITTRTRQVFLSFSVPVLLSNQHPPLSPQTPSPYNPQRVSRSGENSSYNPSGLSAAGTCWCLHGGRSHRHPTLPYTMSLTSSP